MKYYAARVIGGVLVRSRYSMDTSADKRTHASKTDTYKLSQGDGNSTFRSPSYNMHFLGFPELYAYRWSRIQRGRAGAHKTIGTSFLVDTNSNFPSTEFSGPTGKPLRYLKSPSFMNPVPSFCPLVCLFCWIKALSVNRLLLGRKGDGM